MYYSFCLDPCARVNCNYGRCEVDRTRAVCRCYQGYSGSDCLAALGEFHWCSCHWLAFLFLDVVVFALIVVYTSTVEKKTVRRSISSSSSLCFSFSSFVFVIRSFSLSLERCMCSSIMQLWHMYQRRYIVSMWMSTRLWRACMWSFDRSMRQFCLLSWRCLSCSRESACVSMCTRISRSELLWNGWYVLRK